MEWLCTQSAANSSLASLSFRERTGNCVGQIWLGAPETTKMRIFEAAYGEIPCGE
jgi:hypothetical protein